MSQGERRERGLRIDKGERFAGGSEWYTFFVAVMMLKTRPIVEKARKRSLRGRFLIGKGKSEGERPKRVRTPVSQN
jgi:hypothetical protein